jgi:hypothetical protein
VRHEKARLPREPGLVRCALATPHHHIKADHVFLAVLA